MHATKAVDASMDAGDESLAILHHWYIDLAAELFFRCVSSSVIPQGKPPLPRRLPMATQEQWQCDEQGAETCSGSHDGHRARGSKSLSRRRASVNRQRAKRAGVTTLMRREPRRGRGDSHRVGVLLTAVPLVCCCGTTPRRCSTARRGIPPRSAHPDARALARILWFLGGGVGGG